MVGYLLQLEQVYVKVKVAFTRSLHGLISQVEV